MTFLPLLLKTAGLCPSGGKRRSRRNKRWSRSAQTIFASWAVVGQLGGIGLLVAEVMEPQQAQANPPMAGDSSGTATSTGNGAFAIGAFATTGDARYATAIGYFSRARSNYSQALVR